MTSAGNRHRLVALETISVIVPEAAVSAYEAALESACDSVDFFELDDGATWQIEGVKRRGEGEAQLQASLALAAAITGVGATMQRRETDADGWLARVYASFPEQRIGRRCAVRGTHLTSPPAPGRITLTLDAGLAFGSGEHGSTRGCLRALERVAPRRPRRIVDLGTGSGILALGAAALLRRPVLGVDLEEWSVRTARENAARNRLGPRLRFVRGDGWFTPAVRAAAPYDLVFANILARPLCAMARRLRRRLGPRGTVILAGLLDSQERMVLAAHRAQGLCLDFRVREGRWTTLVLSQKWRNS
jgi:ribosomal protein L11 methyltransferase